MGLLGCGSLDSAGVDWPGTGSKPYRNQSLRPGHPSCHPQDSSQEVLASPCFLFLWRAFASLMDELVCLKKNDQDLEQPRGDGQCRQTTGPGWDTAEAKSRWDVLAMGDWKGPWVGMGHFHGKRTLR